MMLASLWIILFIITFIPQFTGPRFTGSPDLLGLIPFPRNLFYFQGYSKFQLKSYSYTDLLAQQSNLL